MISTEILKQKERRTHQLTAILLRQNPGQGDGDSVKMCIVGTAGDSETIALIREVNFRKVPLIRFFVSLKHSPSCAAAEIQDDFIL